MNDPESANVNPVQSENPTNGQQFISRPNSSLISDDHKSTFKKKGALEGILIKTLREMNTPHIILPEIWGLGEKGFTMTRLPSIEPIRSFSELLGKNSLQYTEAQIDLLIRADMAISSVSLASLDLDDPLENENPEFFKTILGYLSNYGVVINDSDEMVNLLVRSVGLLSPEEIVFSHGDFHRGNIGFTEDDLCVIDWETVRKSYPGCDLGRLSANFIFDNTNAHLLYNAYSRKLTMEYPDQPDKVLRALINFQQTRLVKLTRNLQLMYSGYYDDFLNREDPQLKETITNMSLEIIKEVYDGLKNLMLEYESKYLLE